MALPEQPDGKDREEQATASTKGSKHRARRVNLGKKQIAHSQRCIVKADVSSLNWRHGIDNTAQNTKDLLGRVIGVDIQKLS